MSNVYICSDLHLGHKLASSKRGFSTVQDHDDYIINKLKEVCTKKTLLLIAGDVAFNRDGLFRLEEVLGKKKLIKGNHDERPLVEYFQVFDDIHGMYKYKGWCISHCPIHPQEMYRYIGNIHGHIHKGTKSSEYNFGDKYFNVNWDFYGQPIKITDIIGYRGTPAKDVSVPLSTLNRIKKLVGRDI